MQLKSFTGLGDSVIQKNPWGFETLELEIFRSDLDGYKEYKKNHLTEATQRQLEAERATKARIAAEAKGRRARRGVDSRMVEREAEIYVQELDLDGWVAGADRRLFEGMARHLFKIHRANLYGEEIPDTFEYRLKLLTDLRQPTGSEPAVWHDGSGGIVWVPAKVPVDEAELQRWTDLVIEERDVSSAEKKWLEGGGCELRRMSYTEPGELGAYLHELIVRWIEDVAHEHALHRRERLEESKDFLPPTPGGTSSAGEPSSRRPESPASES